MHALSSPTARGRWLLSEFCYLHGSQPPNTVGRDLAQNAVN